MKTLVAAVLGFSAFAAAAQTPIDYRFDEVRRTVTLTSGTQELKVTRGHRAQGGDKVQTGWFSYALIASDRYRAKFELFGSTDVRLAEGTPGVILSVERGRLHAIFDKITGTEPRIVKTPGALLAVRGTQYDVDVDSSGQTTLRVFEGIVELRSELRPEPIFVRAGEAANYGRREAPTSRPMTQHEREQGATRGPGGERGPGGDRGLGNDHNQPQGGSHDGDHRGGPGGNDPHGGQQGGNPPPRPDGAGGPGGGGKPPKPPGA
ncbi:MAG TPA: FecR domain-containing protein [Thermoanaerobaculia bacterium]|jgi:hypothetical protein|nr:FecR domain-containing protein [Thermoanaerobaculia bacterium]